MSDRIDERLRAHFDRFGNQELPRRLEERMLVPSSGQRGRGAWVSLAVGLSTAAVLFAAVAISLGLRNHGNHTTQTIAPGSTVTLPTGPSGVPQRALVGTYTTHITGIEHFRGPTSTLPSGVPGRGTWTLTISASQAVVTNPFGGEFSPGASFSFNGDHVVFGIDAMCTHFDPAVATVGIYTYELVGKTLTFHEVSDSCLDRAATLTLHPWQRK